jgi:hypothetical protein
LRAIRWQSSLIALGGLLLAGIATLGIWQIGSLAQTHASGLPSDRASLSMQQCRNTNLQADAPASMWRLVERACEEAGRDPRSQRAQCVLRSRSGLVSERSTNRVLADCDALDWADSTVPR